MASITYIHTTQRPSVLRRFASSLRDGLVTFMERQARTERIARYQAMSDAELAARGMVREDIVRVVFRDRFYL